MHDPAPYVGYDVLDKWSSLSFDDVTRRVIRRRLHETPERRFFTEGEFATLEAACARLLATAPGRPPLANEIDADLFHGRSEGFRHPEAPPIDAAWRIGLVGLDAEATQRHGQPFAMLAGDRQDATLRAMQEGDANPLNFPGLCARTFFQHVLLKAAAEHFYSRPEVWSEIGFGGPASPRGYVRLALDRRDPWEAPLRIRETA